MVSFVDVLGESDESALARLFAARPDVASPSPGNLMSLAARITNPVSVRRALSTVTTPELEVLDALAVLQSLDLTRDIDSLTRAVDCTSVQGPHRSITVEEITDRLTALFLAHWGHEGLTLSPGVVDALGPLPAGFGPVITRENPLPFTPSPEGVAHILQGLTPERRLVAERILEQLIWGPPLAKVPHDLMTRASTVTHQALQDMVTSGILTLTEPGRVVLDRELAFALRGHRTHRGLSNYPSATHQKQAFSPESAAHTMTQDSHSIASACSAQALSTLRLTEELLSLWATTPGTAVRAGTLAARELRRITEELSIPASTAALLVEFSVAARLVRQDDDAPHDFVPTLMACTWLDLPPAQRWEHLVQWWLGSSRTPWSCLNDDGSVRGVLDPAHHQPWIPHLKEQILAVLAPPFEQRGGHHDLTAALTWCSPRRTVPSEAVAGIVMEATQLGLCAAETVLPGLLTVGPREALEAALPEPVDTCIIQGDLTVLVPGRPSTRLDDLLAASADIESHGGAVTGRFTAASVARAFDRGMSSDELLGELEQLSITGVPQPLKYLVADTARTHGAVRVGGASSYVRFADDATAAAALAHSATRGLGLFELAPRVVASSASVSQVTQTLKDAGFGVVVEDSTGAIVLAQDAGRRRFIPVRPVRASSPGGTPGMAVEPRRCQDVPEAAFVPLHPSEGLLDLARVVRAASVGDDREGHPGNGDGVHGHVVVDGSVVPGSRWPGGEQVEGSGGTSAQPHRLNEAGSAHLVRLRAAIDANAVVDIDIVDSRGTITTRTIVPLTLDGGRLRGRDTRRDVDLTIAVHRIVHVQESGELPAAPPSASL
ncbi:helicase-associated domain-containing protein [Jonesia quinghaiensis]|uniref:helicase-associated domain-containing protein n=1 Tax=Jonesia quinghaiensis TaxID=262806 RepID=UPI000490C515|nr:helicase-associated domain-containing protein [Jonesia quinghaiensis]